MSTAAALRDWFRTCPLIDKKGRFNYNYLGAKATEYAILETPSISILQKYLDGSALKTRNYIFATRMTYGADTRNNINNSGFFDDVTRWVETQSKLKKLPNLPIGLTARKVEVTTSGYVMEAEADTAQLQIQLTLTYFEKGTR